jgi:hypothetical protein
MPAVGAKRLLLIASRPDEGAHGNALLLGLALGQADMGDLGGRESTPGDGQCTRPGPPVEKCVAENDTSQGIRHVRELKTRTNVSRRENSPVARLESVIDQHTLPRITGPHGPLSRTDSSNE